MSESQVRVVAETKWVVKRIFRRPQAWLQLRVALVVGLGVLWMIPEFLGMSSFATRVWIVATGLPAMWIGLLLYRRACTRPDGTEVDPMGESWMYGVLAWPGRVKGWFVRGEIRG